MVAPSPRSPLISVEQLFGQQDQSMAAYLAGLDVKFHRGVFRQMSQKAATQLSQEIRRQIKRRDMPYSRLRNKYQKKKLKFEGRKPLERTIAVRYWSRPSKGLIGHVVGPSWPAGAHGHLVEHGHTISGHRLVSFRSLSVKALLRGKIKRKKYTFGRKTTRRAGDRTIAHGFQEEAMLAAKDRMLNQMQAAMQKAIAKEHKRTA